MGRPNADSSGDETISEALTSGDADELPPEDLARRVFDVSPVSTVVVDSNGWIAYANERATETLGASREEIVSWRYGAADWRIYDDDGALIPVEEYPVTQVLETGESVFGFEHWLERPDGSKRWLTLNAAPLTNEDGEVEYVVVAFEDVTELKRREEQLTSEQMRRVEFRTDELTVPPSLRVDTGEWRIEVESVVSLANDGATVQYMGTSDLLAGEFVTAVEEVPHYVDVRLLSTSDGYSRVEARSESTTVSEVFQSLGGHPRAVVIAHDEVRFLGVLPGDVDPRLAADGIREFHPDVELVSEDLVYSPDLLYDVVVDELTDRQFAALEAAYFSGYFDTPRTSTGDELSDRFDVTRQTFNQHLRKAQRAVLQQLYEQSGSTAR
ncbi:helix-turn-helix domain-containing protein [Natronobacterium gregoryi]|uniref:PAS domain S-box n=2 Tax=Natronobacterium gregoryi TaxID=44930 RepID=L0AC91_NATGS|nr:helix-turn-helix domain-containing protein [Natronobacterium gregoryi]AFZ71518.1 PAS domain S-box [Natronobacterium gregoryi SP2]ELY66576.1 PAS/PAC sensor protein [Natronobacterium gregoryi SP2]PLK21293.1 PAS domain S-box protein [Natronobacterium gregoryi SP2]SFI82940.1 PAS domain S-box-containing protein [Natronobacterium gregoryi]